MIAAINEPGKDFFQVGKRVFYQDIWFNIYETGIMPNGKTFYYLGLTDGEKQVTGFISEDEDN